jgi:hypothetical protein
MKTKTGILILAFSTSFFGLQAQRSVTTTRATSSDISDNLNLEAVASIFGDSENLEDFERRLNDPDSRISNLDLNEDGYIDYLRVVENSSENNSLVVVQAVLDKDVYQDVATIEVEKGSNGNPRVQVIGNSYIYGSNYIIEPVFVHTPLIFSFFWGSRYSPWHSPYYWDNYPRWYSYYRPCSPYSYHRHIYAHVNYENRYHHTDNHNNHFSGNNYNYIRRNDYATRYPNRSFENRHEGVKNRDEMNERRPGNQVYRHQDRELSRSNERQYQNNQGSNSGRNDRIRDINENRRPTSGGYRESNQPRERELKNINSTSDRKPDSGRDKVQRNLENTNSSGGHSLSRGNSDSGSNRERSNSNVRSNQKAEQKPGSTKKENTKDSDERRRSR